MTTKSSFWTTVFVSETLKILYSYHKRIIASSFSGTFFNRYKISYESGALSSESSNVYFFLPSTNDRSENINRYLGSVNLSPIDIAESSFETEDAINFDPSKLDTFCPEKKVITEADVQMSKKNNRFVK